MMRQRTVAGSGTVDRRRVTGSTEPERLRVLHCPWNIAGNPAALAHFERMIGCDSYNVSLRRMPYGFSGDEVLFTPELGPWEEEGRRLQLLRRAVRDFDVVHFNFGQTILQYTMIPRLDFHGPRFGPHNWLILYRYLSWMADLPILRLLNKVIVMTYQGDDARQGDYCRKNYTISPANHVDYYSAESDAWKRRAIRRVARYADRIYALNPDLLRVLPKGARFLPYANVDPAAWIPADTTANDIPVVVHAPSDRAAKGTNFLLQAVDRLRSEGVRFELVLVENIKRDEARRFYERADLVVDQLLTGWYGGFAVEAMCLGKPVVSYIRREDMTRLPSDLVDELPIIEATPVTITDVLRELLTDRREQLPELGCRARRFAEKWHDPRNIAVEIVRDYRRLRAARRWSRFAVATAAEGVV